MNKIRAKKSLGQNFLRSESALKAMVDASEPKVGDIVLEIGPGEGALTQKLLSLATKVISIEKDARLIPFLNQKFEKEIESGKLELIEKDILDFSPIILKDYGPAYKIVANIPYYITGQILRKFLEAENQPASMTLLLQKEVAERIVAKDNKESLLSISVKVFGEPQYIKTVKKGSFAPSPKVDSAIISIRNIGKERFAPTLTVGVPVVESKKQLEKRFFEILKLGFAHKRKVLIKNLEEVSRGTLDSFAMEKIFKKCGLDRKIRAENLKVEDWISLTREISNFSPLK